jgi:hypothetical protein
MAPSGSILFSASGSLHPVLGFGYTHATRIRTRNGILVAYLATLNMARSVFGAVDDRLALMPGR